jgi:hypothetical protein
VFSGFALEPLLTHVGLGDAAELLLVCADGYTIPFDTSALSQPGLRGLLAIRDEALPDDGEAQWAPFIHGAETVSFDPFYLVWASDDASTDLGTETLPWPFQLAEIRRFDRESYFASAQPPSGAQESAGKESNDGDGKAPVGGSRGPVGAPEPPGDPPPKWP